MEPYRYFDYAASPPPFCEALAAQAEAAQRRFGNRQVRRRTRIAGLFPKEDSLLRLVSAILSEISEEWETGKIYLSTEGMPA